MCLRVLMIHLRYDREILAAAGFQPMHKHVNFMPSKLTGKKLFP